MNSINKIALAAAVGTTFMTIYSYRRSKKENQQFVEPVLLNKLIDKSENLPDIKDNKQNLTGWALHYFAGLSFVGSYWLFWRKSLHRPTVSKTLVLGSLSGLAGIFVWKSLLSQHQKPPNIDRKKYFGQLFVAHIVFTGFSLLTYKILHKSEH